MGYTKELIHEKGCGCYTEKIEHDDFSGAEYNTHKCEGHRERYTQNITITTDDQPMPPTQAELNKVYDDYCLAEMKKKYKPKDYSNFNIYGGCVHCGWCPDDTKSHIQHGKSDCKYIYHKYIKILSWTIKNGKHKGTKYMDLPRDYIKWLLTTEIKNPDLKHALETFMQQQKQKDN